MGVREGRVPLDRAVFKILPTSQLELRSGDPDGENLADVYKQCYLQVFHHAGDSMTREQCAVLRAKVTVTGISLRLYILAAMYGFNDRSPMRNFRAINLLKPEAELDVDVFRREAALRYGVFDMTALTYIVGEAEDTKVALQESEWLAASWVVGHRQKHAGGAITTLYDMRELDLDPRWLATETSYRAWLADGRGRDTEELRSHRHRVSQVKPELWRPQRQEILGHVLAQVLAKYQVGASNFEVLSPITRPMAFWLELSEAILQLRCLRLLPRISILH